jgi:hypothetical protein
MFEAWQRNRSTKLAKAICAAKGTCQVFKSKRPRENEDANPLQIRQAKGTPSAALLYLAPVRQESIRQQSVPGVNTSAIIKSALTPNSWKMGLHHEICSCGRECERAMISLSSRPNAHDIASQHCFSRWYHSVSHTRRIACACARTRPYSQRYTRRPLCEAAT